MQCYAVLCCAMLCCAVLCAVLWLLCLGCAVLCCAVAAVFASYVLAMSCDMFLCYYLLATHTSPALYCDMMWLRGCLNCRVAAALRCFLRAVAAVLCFLCVLGYTLALCNGALRYVCLGCAVLASYVLA